MIRSISELSIAAIVVAGFAVGAPQPAKAASCSGAFITCVARCRTDNPLDRKCVSDHCTPKFQSCKSTGCWQQGGRYGNVLTCNLDRS